MADYLELSFELAELDPVAAEAACFASGALAVTFSDAGDAPVLEPRPGEVRLWPATRLQALFAAERAEPKLLTTLAAALELPATRIAARSVADRVWEREWLRDFHAMRFGERLWVCPHHERVREPDAAVVHLDPGLAFGTGTHATTAQCLTWLDETARREGAERFGRARLVDYGCGSGVLALAALQLGARHAYAFDLDPQALEATRCNAADNGVAHRLTLCARAAQLPRGCELLVANILGAVLLELAPRFARLLAGGGRLLLAGILAGEEAPIAAAFAKWFDMHPYAQRDGWVALGGTRR